MFRLQNRKELQNVWIEIYEEPGSKVIYQKMCGKVLGKKVAVAMILSFLFRIGDRASFFVITSFKIYFRQG